MLANVALLRNSFYLLLFIPLATETTIKAKITLDTKERKRSFYTKQRIYYIPYYAYIRFPNMTAARCVMVKVSLVLVRLAFNVSSGEELHWLNKSTARKQHLFSTYYKILNR